MTPLITLSRALVDPNLFGKTFAAPSFWTWRTLAKAIDGVELTEPREVKLFEQCTGRSKLPSKVRRLILLAGRRAGKDRFLSACAIWRAALCADWRKHISAGEQAVVILLGADKKQAAILRRYCQGLLDAPLLAAEITRSTGEVTEFKNGASLEIATNDARLVRGRSAIAVLGSECCHWRTDEFAASSDEEVVGAAEPSMAMCPDGGLLMLGSSVHRRVGYMYRQFKKLHGNDDSDSICWFAPSATMNPQLPASVVDRALAEDSSKARAEYQNIWREDLSDFIPADVIDAATDFGVHERAPEPSTRYVAFADASSGLADSFAFAIASRGYTTPHMLHVVREIRPRFVPAQVVAELAETLCEPYRITEVIGDKYAIGFHENEWRTHGIKFTACERTTSENYLHCLPLLLANRIRLLDNVTLRNQLASLERRVSSTDKETVTHPAHASAHDDVACAACGALAQAAQFGKYRYDATLSWVSDDESAAAVAKRWQENRYRQHVLVHSGYYSARRYDASAEDVRRAAIRERDAALSRAWMSPAAAANAVEASRRAFTFEAGRYPTPGRL
jgi:hypothetical protein